MSFAGAQPEYSRAGTSSDGLSGSKLSDDRLDGHRCTASRFDVRCQLEPGHDGAGPHVAMVRHASSRRNGFAVWTADGRSSWESSVGGQQWAPTFPRVG